ncbi:MAG: hypothetical protein KA141_13055 [Rubrivivax sp.]|nr:hypothetical protein [Rubrivivax sp.]
MNLLSCLHRLPWRLDAASAAIGQPPAAGRDSNEAGAGAPTPQGCGWFDSSHELQQGLLVCEHTDPATLAAEMPLGPWLEMQLAGWQPTLAA